MPWLCSLTLGELFKRSVLLCPCLWQTQSCSSQGCFSFGEGGSQCVELMASPAIYQKTPLNLLLWRPDLFYSFDRKSCASAFRSTNLIFACWRWRNVFITQAQRECCLQIESTPPPPQGLEFSCFPSCCWPALLPGVADEVTKPECDGCRPGRLLQHVPRQAVALILLRGVSTKHPV